MNTLKAFVVEDSALVLRELGSMLAETSSIDVVASADSESGALRTLRVASTAYDLIIIDVFLRQGSGLRVLRDAKALQPKSASSCSPTTQRSMCASAASVLALTGCSTSRSNCMR